MTTGPGRIELVTRIDAAPEVVFSYLIDPERPGRMYAGISSVGLFRTDDGGETWQLRSKGIEPAIPPRIDEHGGRCVHKAVLAPTNSETIFQQNHMGTFRSRDAGET